MWLINPEAMAKHGLTFVLDFINSTPLGVAMDGVVAIHVFFCVSGVALTYPVLRSAEPRKVLLRLGVQRYPRLTIPIMASCLLVYLVLLAGGFFNAAAGEAGNSIWLSRQFRIEPDFSHLLSFALWEVYFGYNPEASWNRALWTMPTELAGSFALFVLYAICRIAPLRIAVLAALTIYFANSYIGGFFVGALFAEAMLCLEQSTERRLVWTGVTLLLIGLALAAAARAPGLAAFPGLHTLLANNVIAALFVAGAYLATPVRHFLERPLSEFLGRISFSLYLVHLIVICSLGSALYLALQPHLSFTWLTIAISSMTVIAAVAVAIAFDAVVERGALSYAKAGLARLLGLGFPRA
jgi:peptidoglycan/LPS O-acetylase OafA/YrhL